MIKHHIEAKRKFRLKAFEHILLQARIFEERIDASETVHWGIINKQGKVVATHLVIDRAMIFRMRRMAYEMYESDFQGDPTLNELALDIVYSSKDEQDGAMRERELSELWARE